MTGTRYRLVTVQNGKAHTSSVVLGADEVLEHLGYEAWLHEFDGWDVKRLYVVGEPFPDLLCVSPRGQARRIYVRAATPFTDCVTLEGQVTSPRGAVVSPGVPPPKRQRPSLPSWLRETDDGFSIEDRL